MPKIIVSYTIQQTQEFPLDETTYKEIQRLKEAGEIGWSRTDFVTDDIIYRVQDEIPADIDSVSVQQDDGSGDIIIMET